MDDAPWFDQPDQFDPRRIRLADIDGSGTTDIIYLRPRRRPALPQPVRQRLEPAAAVAGALPAASTTWSRSRSLDLLGNGTACLVWSSPLPGDARAPLRYVDLMGGQKPHLLVARAQQPRRRDPRRLRAVDPVLPRRPARPARPVDHAAAVPGARRRAGRDPRPRQPQPLRHALRLPPRLLRRRRARVPRLRAGRAVGHRGVRGRSAPTATLSEWRQRRPRLARAAGAAPRPGSTPAPTSTAPRSPAVRRTSTTGAPRPPSRATMPVRAFADTLLPDTHPARRADASRRSARPAARSRARCCARRSTAWTGRRAPTARTPCRSATTTSASCSPGAPTATRCSSSTRARRSTTTTSASPSDPRIGHSLVLAVDDLRQRAAPGGDRLRSPGRHRPRHAGADDHAADLHRGHVHQRRSMTSTPTVRRSRPRAEPTS